MTPDQADNLRDLFMEARKTTRDAVLGKPDAGTADDAAVKAFMDAVAGMVTHD